MIEKLIVCGEELREMLIARLLCGCVQRVNFASTSCLRRYSTTSEA